MSKELEDRLIDAIDEIKIISKYKLSRNPENLAPIFETYSAIVYGLCLKYLKDREAAKDATMDIFEKIIVKLESTEVEHFKSWLYTVSKNHCLMHLRKNSPEIPLDSMEFSLPEHPIEETELEKNLVALEKCIETLKKTQKDCVKLFFLERLSYDQITNQTQLDMKAVKSHIQNGKRNLKICMEGQNEKA